VNLNAKTDCFSSGFKSWSCYSKRDRRSWKTCRRST